MTPEETKLINTDIEEGNLNGERNTFMNRLRILGMAKNLKLWVFLEIIYDFYIAFSFNMLYIIFSILSMSGLYGIYNYNEKYVFGYLFSDVVKFIVKLFVLFTIKNTVSIVITSLVCLANLVYIRTIYNFYNSLEKIEKEDLTALQNGWTPRIIYFVF
jgi:hypothetical protein